MAKKTVFSTYVESASIDPIITMGRELVNAIYGFDSRWERQLFYYTIGFGKETKPDEHGRTSVRMEVSIRDLMEFFGYSLATIKDTKRDIDRALVAMSSRSVIFLKNYLVQKDNKAKSAWVGRLDLDGLEVADKVKYYLPWCEASSLSEDRVVIVLNRRLTSVIGYIKDGNFGQFHLSDLLKLKYKSSWILYRLLAQWKDSGIYAVDISDLRLLMELDNEKNDANALKRQLEKSVKELKSAGFEVKMELLKDGKVAYQRAVFSGFKGLGKRIDPGQAQSSGIWSESGGHSFRKYPDGKNWVLCTSNADESPAVIGFPTKGGSEILLSQQKLQEYIDAYPTLNVMNELRAARQWQIEHHDQRKSKANIGKSINFWLSNSKNGWAFKIPVNARSSSGVKPAPRMTAEAVNEVERAIAGMGLNRPTERVVESE